MRQLLVLVSFVTLAWAAPKPIISPDIIGGGDADAAKNLHAVSIQYNGKHICGGSVPTPNTGNAKFVLTAAHCVSGLDKSKLTVAIGRQDLSKTDDGKTVNVKGIITHDNYDPFDLLNDIALLEVEEITSTVTGLKQVDFNEAVVLEKEYELAGWGKAAKDGEISNKLQIITQKTLTVDDCKAISSLINTANQFCAKTTDANKGACIGDAGSPLMKVDGTNGVTDVQVGIVSWGFGCANDKGDIYTEVSKQIDFINKHVNPTSP